MKLSYIPYLLDKWCYFFINAPESNKTDIVKTLSDSQILQKCLTELDLYTWTEEELVAYDQAEKSKLDNKVIMDTRFKEGLEQWLEQGLEQGI